MRSFDREPGAHDVDRVGMPNVHVRGPDRAVSPGSDYASAQASPGHWVDGARGRAYADRTLKSVHVTIWKGETKVLERQIVSRPDR